MPFFQKNSHTTAVEKINAAKNLLAQKQLTEEQTEFFFEMLNARINDFETALKKNLESYEREQIIDQYNRFAKALFHCLSKPESTLFYTNNYHNFKYYPVGINDVIKKDPINQNISIATAVLGAALILASLAAFAFNPLIGAILLPIGITLLAPACLYLLTPESLDTTSKKLEEKIIFQTGAKLIKPSLNFDEMQELDTSEYTFDTPVYTTPM
ncbi:hypothetical protein [Legionella cincinnatiensis]|uniref:23, 7 kDa protein n=1 Tax=Legionella cincinnatiensis TaxID=28085 RepID=A0A378IIT5_9GAMM|nr:hypothetical protein [Legionella cincinnatiensis]KTC93961.1 23, 7 kDa protein [Legionella cincinnatiensis]STX35167.1 Integral membrane protein (PIN domain superfamily) [Legionella cincinnatiensis]